MTTTSGLVLLLPGAGLRDGCWRVTVPSLERRNHALPVRPRPVTAGINGGGVLV